MPSAFSHAVASVALGRAYTTRPLPLRFWLLSSVCAVAPDIDFLANRFGLDEIVAWMECNEVSDVSKAILDDIATAQNVKEINIFSITVSH